MRALHLCAAAGGFKFAPLPASCSPPTQSVVLKPKSWMWATRCGAALGCLLETSDHDVLECSLCKRARGLVSTHQPVNIARQQDWKTNR
jgi:hypothetical protein